MRFFTSGVKVNMGQTNLPAQLLVQSQQQFGVFPHFMVQSLQASLLSIRFSMLLVIIYIFRTRIQPLYGFLGLNDSVMRICIAPNNYLKTQAF